MKYWSAFEVYCLAESPDEIKIQRDYDTSLPDIIGDREKLIQAVLNIARNAVQAMHEKQQQGLIIFKTRAERQIMLAKKRYRVGIKLDIIDNGPGIPAGIRDKIFYPLVSGREGGSGLGLSLAQTYVSQHQGMIECKSEPGQTTFTILLPIKDLDTKEISTSQSRITRIFTMKAIWIIDDDKSIRWVFEKALARTDLNFKTFSSIKDALAAIKDEEPQVIVSDIRMPQGSGLELLQVIKEKYAHIPVIIMTAYSDLESAVAAFQGGAFEYLAKPFDVDQAIEIIHRAIDESLKANESRSFF